MPAYVNSPFQVPKVMRKGLNTYLFGSYNDKQANTVMQLTQVALAANVGTITGNLTGQGEIPLVGSYISISQTATSSGLFNVNRAIVTAVSFSNTQSGSVSFALTGANVAATADAGTAVIEVPEIGETLVAEASIPCCVVSPENESQFTVTVSVLFPTLPTAATVSLQEAVRDVNTEYTTVATAATVASGAQTAGPTSQFTLTRGNFYRFLVSGLTGTGTIVAKVC